jgi:DNA replication ATP-dependent helicase/nuclease Dna2
MAKTRRSPAFRTNPSAIARYFFHDCERFFYYTSASPEQRKKEGIPEPEFDHSPLIESILQSGHRWETEVIEKLLKGRVVIAPGPGELHTRRLSLEQTLQCLRKEPAGRYLYQATLSPPGRFYEEYDIDPALVVISDNYPDLIEILPDEGGGRLLRILDVKRGEGLKLTHRVQILLYALQLQAMIEEHGITDARVDLEHGGVWLGGQPAPEIFALTDFRPHLEKFLREDLVDILEAGARECQWHLYHRCEWCEFFDHCRNEMRQKNDLSRLVQLTPYGKRHLHEEAHVQNLPELSRFLKRADADEVLSRCASLAGQRHKLQMRVEALERAEPRLHGASSTVLPLGENVGLYLTLQQEPLGKVIYLAGAHVLAREDVRAEVFSPTVAEALTGPDGKTRPAVWVAAHPEDAATVRRNFVLLLHDLLQGVQCYNQRRPEWKNQISLQAYTHTEDERALLFTCLLEALREPDLAEKAMVVLFHFQGPELMHADRHPESEVAYPVVVLLSAVSQLLALPVEVSYTLPEMLEALGSSFHYRRRDYYHFPLGHGFRAEALHAAWYRGKQEHIAEIQDQGRLYLMAVAALLRAVREKAGHHLVTWPPKFTLPKGAGLQDRTLSKLTFFARYESLLRCLAVREGRAEARPTQVLLGQVIELEALGPDSMRVVGDLPVEPEAGGFPEWLLVRDSEEGRRAQMEYGDYWYRNKFHGGPDSPYRAVVGVESVTTSPRGDVALGLKYARSFKGTSPRRGDRYLLYPRFTDFTTDAVVGFLEQLDRECASRGNRRGGGGGCCRPGGKA